MGRIDIAATLASIDLPAEVWEQLDLLGEIIRVTDEQFTRLDQRHLITTMEEGLVVAIVHQQISALKGVYLLLRAELAHQAASQVRLFCEGLITLRYVTLDPGERVRRFLEYSHIEAYEATAALLLWDQAGAQEEHVRRMQAVLATLAPRYQQHRSTYQTEGKHGKRRNFHNWSGRSIAQQATECGRAYEKLYRSIYAQMSAYVHGSAWSLRHTASYSMKSYDPGGIILDAKAIVAATLVVWIRFASLADELYGSTLQRDARSIVEEARKLRDDEFTRHHA